MISKTIDQVKLMLVIGAMILVGQKLGRMVTGKELVPLGQSILGILTVLLICILALKLKEAFPKVKFPAFAWATMIALILSMPFMPTSKLFLQTTGSVDFLATTTPILAFAGISVGTKLDQLKKISWKLVIIAIVVFVGTYFGSALVAQFVLKMQGII
jgi:hypothetical protein